MRLPLKKMPLRLSVSTTTHEPSPVGSKRQCSRETKTSGTWTSASTERPSTAGPAS